MTIENKGDQEIAVQFKQPGSYLETITLILQR